ncbi:GlcNAc-PI de-N-acetylase [Aliiruegeria haliotis]|uniref:GlcNAc-PI de-N-acetylase n=1 Tax=Aliiruegeria haliotis TaxID=1280846 RepID=A0A2T0RYQ6_9RHOB|nr:PIG-L family deacetylase [Aliiruegeria haliotis]PRY26163.1 GlcNAc-PI de-N-acetylase [Aliiruegeria haliotis]
MPLSDPDRILREASQPRILQLWWALRPLTSTISFMNSGAHPDDETSAMLAAMTFRDGFALSYACANRGEGGQNDIGTEITEDLGVLRTAEMERAADVLDMRLYWLSETPEDAIFDFGFSKSGKETLGKWGTSRTLRRFVRIVREERPDILCPTFLDIPGQHGHHRAMTETAHKVMEAAADPEFSGSSLPPWQVSKLYLPAWSGAGQAYDDDLPPPPASLTIKAKGRDPVSGWSWERIGQQSRAFHRTQAMGRWIAAGEERDWPLHLARSVVDGPEDDIRAGLPATLRDLPQYAGAPVLTGALSLAQRDIDNALSAFPDSHGVLDHASNALRHLREAIAMCPDRAAATVMHRLRRKEQQLARVIRLAAEVEVIGRAGDDWLHPGQETSLTIETRQGLAETLDVSMELPDGWKATTDGLRLAPSAPPSDCYPPVHDPATPRAPALRVKVTALGQESVSHLPLEVTPVALPAATATLAPSTWVMTTAAPRVITLTLSDIHPATATPALVLPEGWRADRTDRGFDLHPPETLDPGLIEIPLTLDGHPAMTVRRIAHPHIAPRARAFPAALKLRVLEVSVPETRVGYVGAGNDRVAHWLAAMGAESRELSDSDLTDEAVLEGLDTIVVGIFAIRFREALQAALPRLHAWVEAGGNLVTLYHRPWDNWDPDSTPPRRLEIGQPSLRWRVTDETAEVTCLSPEHALLNTPNTIGAEDWAGWHKERGLYFAKSWDEAYEPLLEMADPEETPHQGALLAARIGQGRHVHCALILHHQMEKLVLGGFRLMANLIAKPAFPPDPDPESGSDHGTEQDGDRTDSAETATETDSAAE